MVNPINASAEHKQFMPMKEVSKTLSIQWYRCPIDKTILRALMQPSDLQGFFHALGHLGLLGFFGSLAFYFYGQSSWLEFFVVLFIHGTIASFLTAPHHELCHKTVFKTKWLNIGFLWIYGFLGWNNHAVYQFSHNYHHRFTLHLEGDREEVMPATPSLRIGYMIQLFTFNIFGGYQSKGLIPTIKNTIELALGKFHSPYNSWGDELYAGYETHAKNATLWARITLLGHIALAVCFVAMGHPILILLVSGAVFIANWWRYFVGVTMHCGLKGDETDFRKSVRSITLDPISEFLYWHMNWHLEHHMFAAVPCYNLKALHHVVRDDMPKPRTVFSAWQEMRETWYRQKTDPDYAYDTPVPARKTTTPDKQTKEMGASIGALGPSELQNISAD